MVLVWPNIIIVSDEDHTIEANLGPFLADRNVITVSGDHIVSARCESAIDVKTGEAVWKASDHADAVLVASCTTVTVDGNDTVRGWDCINGSVIPSALLRSYAGGDKAGAAGIGGINYTQLMAVFNGHGHLHREDKEACDSAVIQLR